MVTEDSATASSRDTWPAANPWDVPSSPATPCTEASYFPARCRQPAIPPAPAPADGLPRARCGLRAPRAAPWASRILGSVGEAWVGRHAEPPASNPANGPGKRQGSTREAPRKRRGSMRHYAGGGACRPKRGRGPVRPLPARGGPRQGPMDRVPDSATAWRDRKRLFASVAANGLAGGCRGRHRRAGATKGLAGPTCNDRRAWGAWREGSASTQPPQRSPRPTGIARDTGPNRGLWPG